MEVAILGPLLVRDDDRPVEVGGQRLRALLVRLAVDAGKPVSVTAIADALWADDAPTDPVNAVQSLVSRLRRVLPGGATIDSGPAGYRLEVGAEAVDAVRFERLAGEGRRALAEGRDAAAAALLRDALALWRGAALSDVADAEYAAAPAARWEELRLACLEDRIEADLRLGRHGDVVAELEALVEAHPLRERYRALLIRALAGAGRQAEALAAYETARRRLADDLGVDPSPELQAVHLAVLRGDVAPRPAPERRPLRSNLRASLTSFVGREDDVAAVGDLLSRSRLVTLVGPGGAGKTRLSGEAARRLPEPPADGVWLVELAPISDPADIPAAVLAAFTPLTLLEPGRIDRLQTAGDVLAPVVDALGDREVVLILDNCEHLVDAVAKLAEEILERAPALRVLATSREPLGVFGESLWPLQPLAAPPAGTAVAAIRESPAVRLFADRASLVRPGLVLDDATIEVVGEICRRLDGLPLAIELAAARLRTLSVEAVAERIGDRFRLLTGGSRTAMSRHQTLAAVVSWSWDLLTTAEQRLAERISVFPGGATVADIEAVCADDVVPADAVLDLVTALAEKSLLVVVDGPEPRYRMLETIREFATERLVQRGGVDELRARHSRHYLAMAEAAEPYLRRAEQVVHLERLNAEKDNFTAALRFATESGDAETAIRLGAALSWYWMLQSLHLEAITWLDLAMSVPGEAPDEPWVIVAALRAIASAATDSGMPDPELATNLQTRLARIDVLTGHPMLALIEPGLAIFADDMAVGMASIRRNMAHPDPWVRAMLHLMIGMFAENDGDMELTRRELPLAIEGFREVGDRWGLGTSIGAMANLHSIDGDAERAIVELKEAQALVLELRATDDASYTAARLAMMRARTGDFAGARAGILEVLETLQTGSAHVEAFSTFSLGVLDRWEGDLALARRRHDEALSFVAGNTFAAPQVAASIHTGLSCLDVVEGDLDAARQHLREAWRLAMAAKDMPVAAVVCTGLAGLVLARGEPVLAAAVLGAAAGLRGGEDVGDPDLRSLRERIVAAVGEPAYEAAWSRGRAMPRDAVFDLVVRHTTAA